MDADRELVRWERSSSERNILATRKRWTRTNEDEIFEGTGMRSDEAPELPDEVTEVASPPVAITVLLGRLDAGLGARPTCGEYWCRSRGTALGGRGRSPGGAPRSIDGCTATVNVVNEPDEQMTERRTAAG